MTTNGQGFLDDPHKKGNSMRSLSSSSCFPRKRQKMNPVRSHKKISQWNAHYSVSISTDLPPP